MLGIDCDASNCCISCERRHLESRDLWHYPVGCVGKIDVLHFDDEVQ